MEWDATGAGRVNILLVDDEPANLLALEAVLAEPGLNLVRAASGEEALRRVLETDFAAVLLDVHMPGLGGFETARLIRARPRSKATPVIFLTAADGDGFSAEQAYALGAVDYLTKPLLPAVLRAKVAVFVELYRKTEALKAAEGSGRTPPCGRGRSGSSWPSTSPGWGPSTSTWRPTRWW